MIEERYTVVCDVCGMKAGKSQPLASYAENEALRCRWVRRFGTYAEEHVCPKCQTQESKKKVAVDVDQQREA